MNNRYSLTQIPKLFSTWKKSFDMEPLFDPLFRWDEGPSQSLNPATDIKETREYYLFSMDLPGIHEKDIHIQIEDGNLLNISGKRYEEIKKEDKSFTHLEKTYGEFYRNFQLSSHIDPEGIQARYKNGVLEVLVPKKENRSTIKIETNHGKSKETFKKYLKN